MKTSFESPSIEYTWLSSATTSSGHREDTDSSSSMVCPSFLSEDTFLLLQSVVMSVQLKDAGALAELEDCLVQSALAEMPQQRELLRKLVINSRNWWPRVTTLRNKTKKTLKPGVFFSHFSANIGRFIFRNLEFKEKIMEFRWKIWYFVAKKLKNFALCAISAHFWSITW